MASVMKKSSRLNNLPKAIVALSAMNACERLTLRKRFESELNQVRMALKGIETLENKNKTAGPVSSSSEAERSFSTRLMEEACRDGIRASAYSYDACKNVLCSEKSKLASRKRGPLMELECSAKVKKQKANVTGLRSLNCGDRRTSDVNNSSKPEKQSDVICVAGKLEEVKGFDHSKKNANKVTSTNQMQGPVGVKCSVKKSTKNDPEAPSKRLFKRRLTSCSLKLKNKKEAKGISNHNGLCKENVKRDMNVPGANFNQESLPKGNVSPQISKSDADSVDGAVSCVEDSRSPNPAPAAASSVINELQLTSSRENRAAFLKKRFAGIILKAQQCTGKKCDLMQKEGIRHIDQVDVKKQRERERTAARIAVHKLTKTVDIYEDPEIVNEIERLRYDGCIMGNPLEWFGLVLKNEYIEELEEPTYSNIKDVEEGEIVD